MSNRIRSFLMFVGLMAALYLLSGCSASYHYQKALRKDPTMFVKDTVKVVDTVWVEIARVDTLFKYSFDTVEFWKDSIFVKYFYQPVDSLVYLEIDCPDNRVIRETNTITETVTIKPTWWQKLQYVMGGIVGGIVLTVAFWIVKKFVV